MREDWERHTATVTMGTEDAAVLLAPAFPDTRIAAIAATEGGKANSNLRVDPMGRDSPLLLRLFTRDPASGAKECALLRLLAGRVPVPRLYYFCDSNPITGHPYAIMDWVDGPRAEDVLVGATAAEACAIARELAGTLAAIGMVAFPQPGFLAPDLTLAETFEPGAAGFLGFVSAMLGARAGARMGDDLRDALQAFCDRNAHLLDDLEPQARLVHCDFDPSNIILTRSATRWRVAAVIDWEFAVAASPLIDIGHLLRAPQGGVPGFAEALAAGYREAGGNLPDRWQATAKLLDLLAWLDFLNHPDERPQLLADARRMIEDTLARWPTFG